MSTENIAQTQSVETPVETINPTEAPKAPEFDFSKSFATLTKREKQIRAMEQKLKERDGDETYKAYQEFKSDPRQKALKLLESHGISYKDLTDLVLNDGNLTPEQQVKALKDEFDLDRKTRTEEASKASQRAVEQTIEAHKATISHFVDSNADNYELISATKDQNSIETVFAVIESHYRDTGDILPMQAACDQVEKEFESQARRLMSLKKFATKEQAVEQAAAQVASDPSKKLEQVTLKNNNEKSLVPAASSEDAKLLDPEARLKWSAQKLKAVWDQKK